MKALLADLQRAKIGEPVGMRTAGMLWTYAVRKALEDAGYKYGTDFEYPHYDHRFIVKLKSISVPQ